MLIIIPFHVDKTAESLTPNIAVWPIVPLIFFSKNVLDFQDKDKIEAVYTCDKNTDVMYIRSSV